VLLILSVTICIIGAITAFSKISGGISGMAVSSGSESPQSQLLLFGGIMIFAVFVAAGTIAYRTVEQK
jgi:hypothetical protein